MKTANPFIPTVPLLSVTQKDRRERVKFAIFCVLGGHVALLLGLLIHGYHSEFAVRARTLGGVSDLPTFQSDPLPGAEPSAPASAGLALKPPSAPTISSADSNPAMQPPQAVPVQPDASSTSQPGIIYTVKSGDTLSQIARVHGTTVAAIRAANNMRTDRLNVGTKLRVPSSKVAVH